MGGMHVGGVYVVSAFLGVYAHWADIDIIHGESMVPIRHTQKQGLHTPARDSESPLTGIANVRVTSNLVNVPQPNT